MTTITKTVEWIVPITITLNIPVAEGEKPDSWQIKHALKTFMEGKTRIRTIGNFNYAEVNVCCRNGTYLSSDFQVGEMETV